MGRGNPLARPAMATARRDFLRRLGALGLAAMPRAALPDAGVARAATAAADFCGAAPSGARLFIPGADGFLGRLVHVSK